MRHLRTGHRILWAGATASAALALSIASCGDGPVAPEPITELPRDLTAAEHAVVQASNTFAVSLLNQVHRAAPDSTVFLSPLSASMALGMTMNGAAGGTLDQMREMLGFGSLSMSDVDASYRGLLDVLGSLDSHVEVDIANAIFHRSTFQFEATFVDTVRTYFDAMIQGLDFANPAAVVTINDWVKQATNNRINGIVDPPIDPQTMAFLLNAIYFKGDWTKRFDTKDTYTGPFHLVNGRTTDVRFMTKKDTLAYRATDAWQAVELPYGGGAWVMTVAVPTQGHSLDDVSADLVTLLDPDASWSKHTVVIDLPRFQLEWERVLNDDLKALGMVDAFSPVNADFTPMFRDAREAELHVQEVKQKTFLRVDETGTEAAAVTSVSVGVTAAPLQYVVKADRPFLLAIRERLSGTVLFAGYIVQAPTSP
ncbi:MAG: serpin family protein [Gemmatimonadetes bacterium]|nr:serpin family protein [Gemmatimonadota bacterium]